MVFRAQKEETHAAAVYLPSSMMSDCPEVDISTYSRIEVTHKDTFIRVRDTR